LIVNWQTLEIALITFLLAGAFSLLIALTLKSGEYSLGWALRPVQRYKNPIPFWILVGGTALFGVWSVFSGILMLIATLTP
jgi:hypothetical protein